MKTSTKALDRREPKQERSRQTVEVVLDAVQRVLKRQGAEAITTNRIAEAAGVSIGSLYQYFPDKRSIFSALHDRHVDRVRQLIERTKADCSSASLEDFTRELVESLANLHAEEAQLHEIVLASVAEGDHGFKRALRTTFEQVIPRTGLGDYTADETHRMLFVLPHMVGALVHGVSQQPAALSRNGAKDEAIRTVLGYLGSCRGAQFSTH